MKEVKEEEDADVDDEEELGGSDISGYHSDSGIGMEDYYKLIL